MRLTLPFQPYLLGNLIGRELQCVVRKTDDGEDALCLFSSIQSAREYRSSRDLGEEWKPFRPTMQTLIALFELHYRSGMRYVVVEPTTDQVQILRLTQLIEPRAA